MGRVSSKARPARWRSGDDDGESQRLRYAADAQRIGSVRTLT